MMKINKEDVDLLVSVKFFSIQSVYHLYKMFCKISSYFMEKIYFTEVFLNKIMGS